MDRGWKNFDKNLDKQFLTKFRERLNFLKQSVRRNVNLEDTASDSSEGNEEHGIRK